MGFVFKSYGITYVVNGRISGLLPAPVELSYSDPLEPKQVLNSALNSLPFVNKKEVQHKERHYMEGRQ